jgi:hypothetical protein
MRYSSETLFTLTALCLSPLALALPNPESTPPTHIVWQPITPKNAWLECLTSRSNGDLLVTSYDTGEIWTVDPATEQATLVYSFPAGANVNSSLGIDEYEDDVFVFNAGLVTPGDRYPIHGTWSVWSIDLRNWTASSPYGNDTSAQQQQPSVSRIAKVPEALMLNGLTVLNPATTTGPRAKGNASNPTLLLADSTAGILYSVNATRDNANQTAQVVYSKPNLLAPGPTTSFPTGLNGLQVPPARNPKHVYFTTGFRGTFYRLALNQTSPAVASGAEPELLAQEYANLDDFALMADGTAYLATATDKKIVKIGPNGEESVVIEGDIVSGGTAAHLVERDGKSVLYVNTESAPNYGEGKPAKLVEIWLSRCGSLGGDGGLLFDDGGFAAEHFCWALVVGTLERVSCNMMRSLNQFVHKR